MRSANFFFSAVDDYKEVLFAFIDIIQYSTTAQQHSKATYIGDDCLCLPVLTVQLDH